MTQTEQSQVEDLKKLLDNDELDGFEKDFVKSRVNADPDRPLSDKQSETLENIWRKHCGPDAD